MNNKTLGVGLILFGLLIVALITRNGDIAWMMLPFLAYLVTGIFQTPSVEKLRFSAERKLEQTRAGGIASVDMSLSVHNQTRETVHLLICEDIQAGMKIVNGELNSQVTLQSGESTALNYTFTAMRGTFSWKSIRTVVSDPFISTSSSWDGARPRSCSDSG